MNIVEKFGFSKDEKIVGNSKVDGLFENGQSFVAYPLRVVYLLSSEYKTPPVSVLISIPKKRIKSAVNRNRIKRLIREAYRLNKLAVSDLCVERGLRLDVGFIYVKDDIVQFADIVKAMKKALAELRKRIEDVA